MRGSKGGGEQSNKKSNHEFMEKILEKVLRIIYASERRMPAHYTSANGRKQTFCINYSDLTEEDEYEMASVAWYSLSDMLPADFNLAESYAAYVKVGEDIMIGAYILTKQDKKELIDELKSKIINNAIEDFSKSIDNYKETIGNRFVEKYFIHCAEFGISRAKRVKNLMHLYVEIQILKAIKKRLSRLK